MLKRIFVYMVAFGCVVATESLILRPAFAQSSSFAKVLVETPQELLLGKVMRSKVSITLVEAAPVMVVTARTEGQGVLLPLKREWRFVQLTPGKTVEFKVPYQLAKGFKSGAVHFDISTYDGGRGAGRKPANQHTATLKLSR